MTAPPKASVLLLNPPSAKPCEAPAGIARLAGALRDGGFACSAADLAFLTLDSMLRDPEEPARDTWTRRAFKNRLRSFDLLASPAGYRNFPRYVRAVEDLNRIIRFRSGGLGDSSAWSRGSAARASRLSLCDYEEAGRSPLRSGDLLAVFEKPESSPLFPFLDRATDKLLEAGAPRIAGISLSFLSQALPAFAIAGLIRSRSPETRLVLGGSLVTSWLRLPGFDRPFAGAFDLLVEGPGERPLLGLARGTEEGSGDGGRGDGGRFFTPDYADFAGLPYLAPGFILPYAASSGCAWRKCAFCPEKAENSPYSSVPAAKVPEALEALVKATSPVLIHFLDSEMSPALLKTLAERPPEVPWYGFARVDPALEDEEFCRALAKAGCVMLKLGIESGSQAVLDSMEKGTTVGSASRVLRSLHAAGISAFVYLLFGTPAEGPEEAESTLEFAAVHADCIGFLNLAIFNLPRGSELAGDLDTAPFYEGDLSLYSEFVHPRGWNRGEARNFIERRFKRHPALAPLVRRLPPYFGSNHAPFFTEAFGRWTGRP